jgi:hypothetical protein
MQECMKTIHMKPAYNLDKLRFFVDAATLKRAIDLHNDGKVIGFREDDYGYSASVRGGSTYSAYVSAKGVDRGNCDCYLGQNDTLCKHMVAVALRALSGGKKIAESTMTASATPSCSGRTGTMERGQLLETRGAITSAMRHIKPYNGPSRIWFAYQSSLSEGCARLSDIVSRLPVCAASARVLVDLLLRLDRKLCEGGVDDSDGTVGGFMSATVDVLLTFAKRDTDCIAEFKKLDGRETCFGWEEPLVALLQ